MLDLFTMASDGSDVKQLTDTPSSEGLALYSPDGTKIAYERVRPLKRSM